MTSLGVVRHFFRALQLSETARARIGNSRMPIGKSSIFCDITLCSPVKVNRRFGGTGYKRVMSQKVELFVTTAVREHQILCRLGS
jgi:hypothetical protein